jgi:hypothetical protein
MSRCRPGGRSGGSALSAIARHARPCRAAAVARVGPIAAQGLRACHGPCPGTQAHAGNQRPVPVDILERRSRGSIIGLKTDNFAPLALAESLR